MGGDWLKIRNDLDDDPHVLFLLHLLGNPDSDLVVGKLRKLWRHADRHTTDGFLLLTNEHMIDQLVGMAGFAAALVKVGWLEFRDGGAQIVRFEDHNGESAKRRLLERARQRKHRARKKRDSVTRHADVTVREEKSREEKKNLGEESPKNPSCSEPPQAASEPAGQTARSAEPQPAKQTLHDPPSGRESQTPDAAAGDPVVLLFPVVGGKGGKGPTEWPLRQSRIAEYADAFPAVDVLGECKKALQWCRDNRTRCKTPRGMPRFLFRWLEKAQNGEYSFGRQQAGAAGPWSDFRPNSRVPTSATSFERIAAKETWVGQTPPESGAKNGSPGGTSANGHRH